MNHKPIWYLGPQEIGRNSQVFATKKEALNSAKARFNNWTQPTDFGVGAQQGSRRAANCYHPYHSRTS